VYKVNNFYHFNVDLQAEHKVNTLKLLIDEKSKKSTSLKLRVNISIPGRGLVHTQLYSEDQIHHVTQLAFKKANTKYFSRDSKEKLHHLTIRLCGNTGYPASKLQVQI
jgi:hypothetical protein